MGLTGIIIAGFTLGLLGSFHCIGMCGPIALVLPVHNSTIAKRILAILLYNIGRALSYAFMGALFGFAGRGLFVAGYQRTASIILGILIILIVAARYFTPKPFSVFGGFYGRVQKKLSLLLNNRKKNAPFLLIGIVNGFLPCGLVYMAIASAIASGSAASGALLMFMFGLGTFPLMFSFMVLSKYLSASFRSRIVKALPFFTIIVAMLLILRGLNLNIPFVSPLIKPTEIVSCH